MDTDLCKLAIKWRTDKTPSIYHGYTPYYHELLKDRKIKKMLEIGIGSVKMYEGTCLSSMQHVDGYITGASLYMWQEYFPEAEIYALDVVRDILINDGRIKSYYCDQGSEASLLEAAEKLGTGFDLIIDDGSHDSPHQILTANTLIPRMLGPGGVYIIEDVGWPQTVIPKLHYKCEVKEFAVDKLHDDRLVVIYAENH